MTATSKETIGYS